MWRNLALALLVVASVGTGREVRADTSVPVLAERPVVRRPLPPSLRRLMTRVQRAAAAHDVRTLARLVDVEFTTGEELNRTASLGELGENPALLDELARLIEEGSCMTYRDTVQCELPLARGSDARMAVFGRGTQTWRLFAFSGGAARPSL